MEQGILAQEQGIFPIKIELSAGMNFLVHIGLHIAAALQGNQESANIQVSSEVIRGIRA